MTEILSELPRGTVLVLDVETGGLNSTRNPLLSLGVLCANEKESFGGREILFAPPENTWLEVPILSDQLKGQYHKNIDHWLNLTTGEEQKPTEEKPASFITAVAAEVNGFVGSSETAPGWDMTKTKEWMEKGFGYASGAEALSVWLGNLACKPICNICHNAEFDQSFVKDWLPELGGVLPSTWACTQLAYKNRFLGGKTKGSSLAAICKTAGYTADTNKEGFQYHRAIGDCEATLFIWRWLLNQ